MERTAQRFPDTVHSASKANSQSSASNVKMLYCIFCKKEKPLNAFSKTQITKSVSHIQNPYAPRGFTTKKHKPCCKQCTPNQQTQLTCMICTKSFPLDKFAKSQRRNAEKARCIECMKKREKEDPNFTPSDSDYESDSDEKSGVGKKEEDDDNEFGETWHDLV
jgi:hypothetical protein